MKAARWFSGHKWGADGMAQDVYACATSSKAAMDIMRAHGCVNPGTRRARVPLPQPIAGAYIEGRPRKIPSID